ncbi:MAG: L-2-hydroxyglutarate oxidase [Chloroflexi bacterium]|nr:L-2-hydroxyglutarate oxidase [Chloroflexota bacterium]
MNNYSYDIAIIGGGIIGLATALEVSIQYPRYRIGVVEKEEKLAAHQTGHNSGVIHSGIYYKPGSLKARNCVTGGRALMEFCRENGIEYELCGKVIVATDEREMAGLDVLYERGVANGVPGLRMIGAEELKELEPHARGLKALHSPNTGIIDYTQVTLAYADRFRDNGGEVVTGARVRSIRQADGFINMETDLGDVRARHLINCAGLYSDVVARMMGVKQDVRIIPFRGEYYMLSPEARHLVRGLIYPVPNPEFPFLGVHFTRTVHGDVEAGPNAVLAFAREGYKMTHVNVMETLGTLSYRGFWAMGARYWKRGMQEFYRSLSKAAFVRSLQQLVPEIDESHLERGGAGVRAQEVERNGLMADDFHITETPNAIHVRNAPSPGATASLAIGKDIVAIAAKSLQLT